MCFVRSVFVLVDKRDKYACRQETRDPGGRGAGRERDRDRESETETEREIDLRGWLEFLRDLQQPSFPAAWKWMSGLAQRGCSYPSSCGHAVPVEIGISWPVCKAVILYRAQQASLRAFIRGLSFMSVFGFLHAGYRRLNRLNKRARCSSDVGRVYQCPDLFFFHVKNMFLEVKRLGTTPSIKVNPRLFGAICWQNHTTPFELREPSLRMPALTD